MVDLRIPYRKGVENLLRWRNRYSKEEYPLKVVKNIFYRKYTMELIFPELVDFFHLNQNQNERDFGYFMGLAKEKYSNVACYKVNPVLEKLLIQRPKVGTANYNNYTERIANAESGDSKMIETIEFDYLFYLLTDECILLWTALGGSGDSQVDAFGKLTGLLVTMNNITRYQEIETTFGQFCVSKYLKFLFIFIFDS